MDRLDNLKPPIFLTALGSYAFRDPATSTRPFWMEPSAAFLRLIPARGGRLGARDALSLRLLSAWGVTGATLVGDPAWYDLDWLERNEYASARTLIAFTPPANPLFQIQGLTLLRALS